MTAASAEEVGLPTTTEEVAAELPKPLCCGVRQPRAEPGIMGRIAGDEVGVVLEEEVEGVHSSFSLEEARERDEPTNDWEPLARRREAKDGLGG